MYYNMKEAFMTICIELKMELHGDVTALHWVKRHGVAPDFLVAGTGLGWIFVYSVEREVSV
jgi:hypothetical protein